MLRFIIASISFLFCLSEEITSARLFVHKTTNTDPVVEGKDFIILYNIYNQGRKAAHDIVLTDRFDPKSFEIKGVESNEGEITLNLDEIQAGEHKSLNVTIVAKLYGMYDSTRASVSYTSTSEDDSESDDEEFKGVSSSMPRTKILSKEDYRRISSYYAQDWVVFVLLSIVTTVIPFATWRAKNKEASTFSKKRKGN